MPTTSVLGGQSEATIDQANIAMRASPWYQQQLRAWGQDPGHPTISDSQRTQLTRLAQANGFVVDEGNIEMDDHGNFNPKGHKLRNTMIVIGLAAATIATMGAAGAFAGAAGAGTGAAAGTGATVAGVEGGAAGLSSGALAGLGTGAMGATALPALGTVAGVGGAAAAGAPVLEGLAAGGGSTAIPVGTTLTSTSAIEAAKAAGYTINADGVVMDAANVPPDVIGGAASGGRSYADLVKYGLPIAGGIAQSIIQANATGKASDAQQKYLEEALAYEKESDLYKRGVDAAAVVKEAGRYADYTGRITPFVDNGISSNDRMSSLLGLPARSGATSGGSYSYGTKTPQGVALSPELTQRVLDNYKALGLTPTGPGSGPTDTDYFAKRYAETGGSTPNNDSYWFGPQGRIAKEATQAGLKFTPGASSSPTTPAPTASTPAGAPGAPVAPPYVTLRTPDGTIRTVPADQVDQLLASGATRF